MTRSLPYPIPVMDAVGLVKDLSPEQVADGGLQEAQNVRLTNGRAMALFGHRKFYTNAIQGDASKRVMHGDQLILLNGLSHLVVLTLTKAYRWNTGTSAFDDISGGFSFTGSADNFFMTEVGFNLLLIANGIDAAKKWSGSGNIATLGGLSTAAPLGGAVIPKILRSFQNFTIALNNIEDGGAVSYRVRWGRIGQVEVWTNDINGNGQAGYNDLNDTARDIKNALKLGNYLAIYKADGIYLMSYIGLPAIFDFRKVVHDRGLYAPRALVSLGTSHFFLSDDNFYAFDGAQAVPIGDKTVKDFFFNDLSPIYADRTQAIFFKQYNEVWWAYCSTASSGDFDKVLIYNYRKGTWYSAAFSSTAFFLYTLQDDVTWADQPDLEWDLVPGPWNNLQFIAQSPLLMFGDASGIVYQHGLVYSQDGASYTKYITTKLYDFKRPGVFKRLQRIQLSTDQLGLSNLEVYVGTANHPSDTITWSGPYSIIQSAGQPYISCDLTAVFFAFKFQSTGTNDSWEIRGMTPWFIERGRQ